MGRDTTRRQVLALAIPLISSNAEAYALNQEYVDAHVHIWAPESADVPRDPHYAGPKYEPASFTPDELFSHTRPNGVSRVVLIQMSFYGTDNSYMLRAMQAHPGVFSGVAVIDAESPRVAVEMKRLKSKGVRGFRITPGHFVPAMWKAGAEQSLAMCVLGGPDSLPSVQTMCRDFPDTTVVIDHLARIGATGTVKDAEVSALCTLAKFPRVFVKVSAFYALGRKKAPYTDLVPAIRECYNAFGAQRLMWASDSPFQVQPPHTYSDSLELVKSRLAFLTDADREWLLRKTAEKVFFA